MPPIITELPFMLSISGTVLDVAVAEARFWPKISTMVPGASAEPTRGLKACSVPLGDSNGTAWGDTAPVSGLVTAAKLGELAVTLIVTCDEGLAGDQVPE